jgi:hypothetical protein
MICFRTGPTVVWPLALGKAQSRKKLSTVYGRTGVEALAAPGKQSVYEGGLDRSTISAICSKVWLIHGLGAPQQLRGKKRKPPPVRKVDWTMARVLMIENENRPIFIKIGEISGTDFFFKNQSKKYEIFNN